MKILMNTGGIAGTNSFLVADEHSKQAVLIDAPNDTTAPLLDEAAKSGWDIVGLWLTHGHFDHMADHAVVRGRFPNARIVVHELDEPKLLDPNELFRTLFVRPPFTIPPCTPDLKLRGGEKLRVGNLEFEVIYTPGHCAGHVAYYCADEKVIAGGDLIIAGAVGRSDLPDSNPAQLEASIRRVMQLPGETKLLPGHGDISTLQQELQTNYFVQEAIQGA